jgi:hypothetical protein
LEELISGKIYRTKVAKSELNELKKKLIQFCEKQSKTDKNFSLELKTLRIKEREKGLNCKTFHGAGIYVPVNAE